MSTKIVIKTTDRVIPMIYAYTTPEIARHNGWTKIGYTEQDVDKRLSQQTHTADVEYKEEWRGNATFEDGSGDTFTDKDFHRYLRKLNIENDPKNEWFHVTGPVSRNHFYDFRANRGILQSLTAATPYNLREEQEDAVEKTLDYSRLHTKGEYLWNAKPRFGKTLTAYELCKQMDADTVLIVTNRPAIANSWYSDYEKFLGPDSGYLFVSDTSSLQGKPFVVSRNQYLDMLNNDDYKCIEFVSLQDLKGSIYFGGEFEKLKEVNDIHWDVLIIDEAHEGVDTYKTDVAFDHIDRNFTLHLSGTPFKAIASEKFKEDAIYNWTYADEQKKKRDWQGDQSEQNPYANLPQLNMFTYQMSEVVRDELKQGIEINGENIDLNPNLSEVAKNIESIQKFFSGMDYFYGDVEQAKKDYFKYMTWYLATPFMAYLRYFASRNNYDTKLFPMYGVIYGDSNGGKTTFIKFLVKLMCGETVKMNTTEDFTATRIDGLKRVCEGLPLNIDDLAKTQFQNHSERVIKNDEWGISDRLVNYPAVSITSNKITSLTKDLSKRAIICRIGAKIDNERGAKNSKRVNESMSELTTAFYGEYVRRMLVCIDEMTTEMRENANGKEYFPDIFHASSSVIADIFEACGIDLPDYVRILYYNDYMGDESIGRAAIEKIELAWQADPSKFRVDKKQNRLIYSYPPDGPWYELKYIADELPNSLEAEISGGNQLIMNYEQAQELFGIKFRRWLGIFNL